jgi:hypothetical protein
MLKPKHGKAGWPEHPEQPQDFSQIELFSSMIFSATNLQL